MVYYTIDQLARLIDHTNLKPFTTEKDMHKLCEEAVTYHFKIVAINQVQTKICSELLAGTDIQTGAAISFPLGQTSIPAKVAETEDAIKNGANEIDYVINIAEVKNKNWNYLKKEMEEIVTICRKVSVLSKVIFENAYLTDTEKIELCTIANIVEPDFIKTSTGFAPSGATFEDIKLMRKHTKETVQIKAAGGIRDAATFKQMIALGATRIGTSSGIKIIQSLTKEVENGEISI
ncbi:deoxyribose-phosphate aldolase [Marinilactibacillus psychrotolerans]|uniref:Deoxyribose-phosphate aldolase n=1 Tax=Marinilactibacillus psychrotolerans TaxID=191770 RepID=A0AAV3WQS7_9LACT|nr:deoxyribose-phosphate aldolase [Marinilactibacillus psychrotolerans]GEL67069.1 deoxyribose-phosphate aldolase [Marinilactibacillus psychrotolerans]GEQ36214.1 deoxyribose-phosphate aldolase [Marinilactibacillus psychrotolerans]SDC78464.1 deoxyribose-phosphate aldolase [Marinilactibacillus psychrotolerans]